VLAFGTGNIIFRDNAGAGTLDPGDVIDVVGYSPITPLAVYLTDPTGNLIGQTGNCA
jgi:hypothetical protein